ncbi:MAG: hypothetical protein EPGJADBJ_05405 [Saprospiraceae bacterium]|nr:hypothetical protein [Saprospiraceae bacterium]
MIGKNICGFYQKVMQNVETGNTFVLPSEKAPLFPTYFILIAPGYCPPRLRTKFLTNNL